MSDPSKSQWVPILNTLNWFYTNTFIVSETTLIGESIWCSVPQPVFNPLMNIWGISSGFCQIIEGLKQLEEGDLVKGNINLLNGAALIGATVGLMSPFVASCFWAVNSGINLLVSLVDYYNERTDENYEKVTNNFWATAAMIAFACCPLPLSVLLLLPLYAQALIPSEEDKKKETYYFKAFSFFSNLIPQAKVNSKEYVPTLG